MAVHSLLALLDDITLMLDDVAILTKVAAKKTAGVLGDDLALNAQQIGVVRAEREWPVVWAVAKGSFWNKCILVPLALLLSALAPWLITPLLMAGGVYLCFEGIEKIAHSLLHNAKDDAEDSVHAAEIMNAMQNESVDLVALEKEKIQGAIRTDFILSAEIIVIALGTLAAGRDLATRSAVLVAISILMTVGVYGLVALIVKIDDLGLWLLQCRRALSQFLGRALLWFAPRLMKTLGVVGTVAMFLVGGGILTHSLPFLHHFITEGVQQLPAGAAQSVAEQISNLLAGALAGVAAWAALQAWQKIRGARQ